MSEERLGRRYARALFDLASESGSLDAVHEQLGALTEVLEEAPDLAAVLASPDQSTEDRKAIFLAVAGKLGTGDELKNLVRYMIDRGRMSIFEEVAAAFNDRVDESRGQVRGEVVTALPLDEKQLEALGNKLEAMSGKKVQLTVREDPSLIGGLVARVGDKVFDASIRSRLDRIKRTALSEGV